jgi:hypothetical protein
MAADKSTAVVEKSATKKSLLKRLFSLYAIILIVVIAFRAV